MNALPVWCQIVVAILAALTPIAGGFGVAWLKRGQRSTHSQLKGVETAINGRMEELLKATEERGYARGVSRTMQDILDLLPDMTVEIDANTGAIVRVNRAALLFFGYSINELIGHGIEILLPFGDRVEHVAQRKAYVENPTIRPMGVGRVVEGRKRDGSVMSLKIFLAPHLESGHMNVIATIRRTNEPLAKEAP